MHLELDMPSPMSQLKEYLSYYKSLQFPGYAVLVTGAWGAGKTHQVKKALKKSERYYVSLFGLESRADIEAALLSEADPDLNSKKSGLNWTIKTAKEVGGLYSLVGVLPSAINALLRIELDPDKVIIFDDLERCNIDPKTLFGIINWFVEHHGSKVVVIAHDDKLQDSLNEQKEKLFGQTIDVEPQLVTAFFVFLNDIRDSNFISAEKTEEAVKFLRQNRQLIFSIFERQVVEAENTDIHVYKGNSLRVLKQSLFDVARLYSCISPKLLEQHNTIERLITEFCIFNLEHKMGTLPVKSLSSNWGEEMRLRWERRISSDDTIPLSPLEQLEFKYSHLNLDRLLLDQKTLYETIVAGNFNANHLNEQVTQSTHMTQTKDLPAWRRFMSFDELGDDIVEDAKEELLR